jgi:hypothetical protein
MALGFHGTRGRSTALGFNLVLPTTFFPFSLQWLRQIGDRNPQGAATASTSGDLQHPRCFPLLQLLLLCYLEKGG